MPLAPVIQLPFPLMIPADAVSEQLIPIFQKEYFIIWFQTVKV